MKHIATRELFSLYGILLNALVPQCNALGALAACLDPRLDIQNNNNSNNNNNNIETASILIRSCGSSKAIVCERQEDRIAMVFRLRRTCYNNCLFLLTSKVEREKRQQQQRHATNEHADEAMRSPSQMRSGTVNGTSRRPSGREVLDMRPTPSRHRTITKS